ncbi:MAG: L-histidine N(alpha)-methyltransferase [Candidatus Eisenbacteria bacterium]
MSDDRIEIEVHLTPEMRREDLRREVRAGFERDPREIPPKYFYDAHGSALFEEITKLPEYYLTRVETRMLRALAPQLAQRLGSSELLELGSGYSTKTEILLDALRETGRLQRYLAVDVSESSLRIAGERLMARYPGLQVHGVVADFTHQLDRLPKGGPRLVAFLGSTIGNFAPEEARQFLTALASTLGPDDAFLLGTDLIKDLNLMEDAYNDHDGITAEFNRNILSVLNDELGAGFQPEQFEHVAFYDDLNCWIEMRLRSKQHVVLRVFALDDERPYILSLERGEEIRTEISCKYTRESVEALLESAGLELCEWHTEADPYFALSLSRLAR